MSTCGFKLMAPEVPDQQSLWCNLEYGHEGNHAFRGEFNPLPQDWKPEVKRAITEVYAKHPKPGLSITMKTPPAYRTAENAPPIEEMHRRIREGKRLNKPSPSSIFFGRLRSNSQAYHLFVGWMETRLEIRTISQMQVVKR